MARKKSYNDNFADLVARLNAMSNMTPEQERKSLMEAASAEPKLLDEKDVSLADIAKLAGIKEYVEPIKVSRKAQKMVENITQPQSDIAKAIKLKSQEKEEATLDDKSFRERFVSEITEYVKKAEGTELADLYNKFSMNEVELQEKNFLIKTPETKEVIADAEAKEAEAEAEVVQEKEPKAEEPVVEVPAEEPAVETPEIPVGTEDPQVEIPTKDKFTNDLDPAPKADKK